MYPDGPIAQQQDRQWCRGEDDIRLPTRIFRRRDMDVELHTTRQQFSREVIDRVGIARDDMQALQRKDAESRFMRDEAGAGAFEMSFISRMRERPWSQDILDALEAVFPAVP